MKHKAFSAHDSKIGVYHPPFFMQHTGQALRAWDELCNDPKTQFNRHPSDFQLYEVGTFDDETGRLDAHTAPQHLSNAADVIKRPSSPGLQAINQ